MRGRARGVIAVLALTLIGGLFAAPPAASAASQIPSDVRLISSWTDPLTGYVWDRYQQYAAPLNVFVDGGQLVVIRHGSSVVTRGGSYFPGLRVSAAPRLSPAQAVSGAGSAGRSSQLRVDPHSGRQFYRVTISAPGVLQYQDIDANTGALIASWNGLETALPSGTGVKGDTKDLTTDAWDAAGQWLTSSDGHGGWLLQSADGRFVTSDANHSASSSYPSAPMADADNSWTTDRQRAGVDAQYYAALTDNFYRTKFAFDLTDADCLQGRIHSVVHYANNYDNAYWDSDKAAMVYGDGDGSLDGQFSGAQDIVSHELSHAVTSCEADLDYIKESGALNEAFSDIMATTIEFEFEEPNSSNCVREAGQSSCADWWIAEDDIIGGSAHAFRSMANPGLLGQPSHYAARVSANTALSNCRSFNDYCGVHYNSGIANHAFYLLVNGGRNARCTGPTDSKADCDVLVPGIGLDHAANIFQRGWFALTNDAKFCDARTSSIEQAQELVDSSAPGYTQADVSATELAWDAVGVYCATGSAPFNVVAASRSTAVKPGGSTSVSLNVSPPTALTYTAAGTVPATVTFPSGSVHFDVDADAAPGTYLVTITATDGAATQHIPIVLIVDGDNPSVAVTDVQLTAGTTVATDGQAPLSVLWNASDQTSGVVEGTSGSLVRSSTDGVNSLTVTVNDLAGNSATSAPFSLTRSSFQENSATYKKTWSTPTSPTWGSTRFSKTKGATAVITFTGTDIAWVSNMAPKRGKAKVYIDGVQLAVVDLKSATTQSRVIVFVASGLSAGQHTLKIYVNGTSGRPRVDVDGFIVLSN